ncbi:hypothetical protein GCM10022420_084540 [Streptomyces iranensis]
MPGLVNIAKARSVSPAQRLVNEPGRRDAALCGGDQSSLSPSPARHRHRADRVEHLRGRGPSLVAQLTQRWGTRYASTGKAIWTEVSPTSTELPSARVAEASSL